MKVEEMIDILSKYPKDREVRVYVDDGGYFLS